MEHIGIIQRDISNIPIHPKFTETNTHTHTHTDHDEQNTEGNYHLSI